MRAPFFYIQTQQLNGIDFGQTSGIDKIERQQNPH